MRKQRGGILLWITTVLLSIYGVLCIASNCNFDTNQTLYYAFISIIGMGIMTVFMLLYKSEWVEKFVRYFMGFRLCWYSF